MSTLDLILICVVSITGALGGSLIGIAGGIGVPLAKQGATRWWIRPALYVGTACGLIVSAVGIWGLATGRSFINSLILMLLGLWMAFVATRILQRLSSV
ncbi:MAG: hypothetical protein ACKV0T_10610 [Planctomycetales bacterium]